MNDAHRNVVFVGPTLPREEVAGLGPVWEIRGPAMQGDVLKAVLEGFTTIVLIDGRFGDVPSVGHREILFAISEGRTVVGTASMGALRAAELETFGMIGDGSIFERFRAGALVADDEVAVLHGGAEFGFRPSTLALVDIRDFTDEQVHRGEIHDRVRTRIIHEAKRLNYQDRTLPQIAERCSDVWSTELDLRWRSGIPSRKAEEAKATLAKIDAGQLEISTPTRAGFRFQRTRYFDALLGAVRRELDLHGSC